MRIKGLDFLRGIAIIGVLFRHNELNFFLSGPGGYGVDLFFVLSGFLVSGLLFSEYKRRGKVNTRLFLIRRGFKIYPAFYFFILVSILFFGLGFESYFPFNSILSEVLFLQSYFPPMWTHTWSLAVEEHFYFLLSLIIFLTVRFRWILKNNLMVLFFIGAIIIPLILRINYVYADLRHSQEPFFYTHLRIDGLFMGALLGYLWHFRPAVIEKFYRKKKIFAFLSILFVAPVFFLKSNNLFMLTLGFNLMHISFALAVLLVMSKAGEKFLFENRMTRNISFVISYIGLYSYSIYIWHLFVQNLLLRSISNLYLEGSVYFIASILFGIAISKMIEIPMLRFRDKYFPRN